jgi:hypothetical protein
MMKDKKVINFIDIVDTDTPHTIKNTSALNPPHTSARGVSSYKMPKIQ